MLLENTTGLIFGVSNRRSIAWAIAQSLAGAGARLAFTYRERVGTNVKALAATLPGSLTMKYDVRSDGEIQAVMDRVDREFDGLDTLVHSVAFAPKEALDKPYLHTTRQAFQTALGVSAYSLIAMARSALPLMQKRGGGSIITLTYLGSERVFPNYNVMGVSKAALEASVRYLAHNLGPHNIRVNAISAGPIRTLAAKGIRGFSEMHKGAAAASPLKRDTELSGLGDLSLLLSSRLGRGVTGQVIYLDSGYHIMGALARGQTAASTSAS